MNYSALFCQLFVIVVGYVFCDPTENDLFERCFELKKVESAYFNTISEQLKKYICYNVPAYENENIDYKILYANGNATRDDDIDDKWITCLSFNKTRTKVIFLNYQKLTAFIKKENDWKLVEFEFNDSGANDIYNDLTEIPDERQAINGEDWIRLERLSGEGNSASLTIVSFSVNIYSEMFDPEPNKFDSEDIMIIIVRSSVVNTTVLVLSKGDFWISEVKDKYITLFVENYENFPYVITFADNSVAEKYHEIIIEWVREDKRDVPFPENVLRLLLQS